ncbi:MAG: ParB/RepB/Spo0J family partition protein [Nitrospirae bacterium]|nr:ParB/RepB/Spo0J family partition protein [Nitrospirota bacterium]
MGKGIRDLFSKKGEEALQKILGCDETAPLCNETQLRKAGEAIVLIPVSYIAPNPFQPRTLFDEEKLSALAESLKDRGMLQPVLLRQVMTPSCQKYELVAGERRLRAAKIAGLTDVPAVVKELEDKDMRVLTLVENLQREDLNVVEKTLSIGSLHEAIGDLTATARALALSKRSIERYVRIYSAIGASELLLTVIKRNAHLIDFKDAEALADIVRNLGQEGLVRFIAAVNSDGIKRAIKSFRNSQTSKPGRNANSQSVTGAVRETATHIRLLMRYEKGSALKAGDRDRLRIVYEDFAARIEKSKNTQP